jgi:hypothetical protein
MLLSWPHGKGRLHEHEQTLVFRHFRTLIFHIVHKYSTSFQCQLAHYKLDRSTYYCHLNERDQGVWHVLYVSLGMQTSRDAN